MVDVKRLKGAVDLAQLNHNSFQNEDTLAALEAAKDAYELALEAADDEDDLLTNADIAQAQAKLDQIKADKAAGKNVKKPGSLPKSTAAPVGVGSVAAEPAVTPNHRPIVTPSATNPAVEVVTSTTAVTTADGGAAQGEPSDATKAAQDLAAEKKSE